MWQQAQGRVLFTLVTTWIVVITCDPCFCDEQGQKPGHKNRGGVPIDLGMFHLSTESGGDFYFWMPGEFAVFADKIPSAVLVQSNYVPLLRDYGDLSSEERSFAFSVDPHTKNFTVLAGVQIDPILSLWDPSGAEIAADESAHILRTSHMFLGVIENPQEGEWRIKVYGSGKYLVSVRSDVGIATTRSDEIPPDLNPDGLTEYYWQQFKDLGGEDRWDLVRNLSSEQRIAVSRILLNDRDAQISYNAAGILIREGHEKETIPTIVDLIVNGKVEKDLNNRLVPCKP